MKIIDRKWKFNKNKNVLFSIFRSKDKATGVCAVHVNNVNRTCIAILDACESYPLSHTESILK